MNALRADATLLRRQSGRFATLVIAMVMLLVAVIALSLFGISQVPEARLAGIIVRQAIDWLALVFYLWGLFAIRRTFRDIAAGGLFEPAISRGLRHLGLAVLGGSAASAVVVPNLRRLAMRTGLLEDTLRPWEAVAHFDVAFVMLGVVGFALILLSRLIGVAGDFRARANALETELGEFL